MSGTTAQARLAMRPLDVLPARHFHTHPEQLHFASRKWEPKPIQLAAEPRQQLPMSNDVARPPASTSETTGAELGGSVVNVKEQEQSMPAHNDPPRETDSVLQPTTTREQLRAKDMMEKEIEAVEEAYALKSMSARSWREDQMAMIKARYRYVKAAEQLFAEAPVEGTDGDGDGGSERSWERSRG